MKNKCYFVRWRQNADSDWHGRWFAVMSDAIDYERALYDYEHESYCVDFAKVVSWSQLQNG